MSRTCSSGFPTGEPGIERSTSEVAMGRRWSYDEISESEDFYPTYAFTDHRDDDVKFTMVETTEEIAKMVYEALNHECDHSGCCSEYEGCIHERIPRGKTQD